MPNQPNSHVSSFLEYYCALDRPEYAVLVDGCWGSGKTWLIREFFRNSDPERKSHIYVSLYGIRSTSEIEREFFVQLHPKLSSTGVTVAGRIIGSAARFSSNLILKTSPETAGLDAAFQSWLTDTEGRILVFDDLERCVMPMKDILGYINYFVEHGGYRCVVLANEKEIAKLVKGGKDFSDFKEKLFGQSLAVEADIDAALDAFLSSVPSTDIRELLAQHRPVIREVFSKSGDNNLRVIRHAVFDAARVLGHVTPDKLSNSELVQTLLAQHLAYAVEVRSGRLRPESIGEVKTEHLAQFVRAMKKSKDGDAGGSTEPLAKKYPLADLERPIVNEQFYSTFYRAGHIDASLLNSSIADSHFFYDINTQSWQLLLDLWSLSEDNFRALLADVQSKTEKHEYRDIGIVKHVFGMLMFLAERELISSNASAVLVDAQDYVNFLLTEGVLAINVDDWGRIPDEDSYAHTQFWGIGIPEFETLREYILIATRRAIEAQMPQVAAHLLEEMVSDPSLFERRLYHTNSADNRFYNKPVLNFVSSIGFVDKLIEVDQYVWRHVTRALRERYAHPEFARALIAELPWLRDVSSALSLKAIGLKGTLDEVRIKKLVETVDKSIEVLERSAPRVDPGQEDTSETADDVIRTDTPPALPS